MSKRVPRDKREPVDLHLLLKHLEMDQTTGVMRIYLLVDEVGCECVAKGILPGYVQQQARDALAWFAIDERKGNHQR